jgi:hypothetical protein
MIAKNEPDKVSFVSTDAWTMSGSSDVSHGMAMKEVVG